VRSKDLVVIGNSASRAKNTPPRKEKPELPPIEEVELSYSDKETIKKYQDKIDLLVAHGANR